MTRYTISAPLTDSDGEPVNPAALAVLESELVSVAGGFTASLATGAWYSEERERILRDPVRVYTVDAPEGSWHRSRILSIADALAVAAGQEAVYVTESPVEATLVRPSAVLA